MKQYKYHPISQIFPLASKKELTELREDIEKNGLQQPIILFEEMILDGRNRIHACQKLKIEPRFSHWCSNGTSPIEYVLRENKHRRQLTVSQKAVAAAEVFLLLKKERESKTIKYARGRPKNIHGVAKDFLVGTRTVQRALKLKQQSPVKFQQVKNGLLALWDAVENIDEGNKSKRRRILERAEYNKMVTVLSTVGGLLSAFPKLNILYIKAECAPDEFKRWQKDALNNSAILKDFAKL